MSMLSEHAYFKVHKSRSDTDIARKFFVRPRAELLGTVRQHEAEQSVSVQPLHCRTNNKYPSDNKNIFFGRQRPNFWGLFGNTLPNNKSCLVNGPVWPNNHLGFDLNWPNTLSYIVKVYDVIFFHSPISPIKKKEKKLNFEFIHLFRLKKTTNMKHWVQTLKHWICNIEFIHLFW